MSGGPVQEVVVLLDVLAMIALRPGEAEQPLLERWVGLIPQGERKAQAHLVIAHPEQPVLAPAIRSRSRMIVWEAAPGITRGRVIFADGSPLAFGQVGP